mgnify:CR=1 FL=1
MLETLITKYRALGIDKQIDYDKFYLYSLVTHSTAIEGSTITELENQILFLFLISTENGMRYISRIKLMQLLCLVSMTDTICARKRILRQANMMPILF